MTQNTSILPQKSDASPERSILQGLDREIQFFRDKPGDTHLTLSILRNIFAEAHGFPAPELELDETLSPDQPQPTPQPTP